MKYGELTRKLRRLGITLRRQAGGSHEIWWNAEKKRYTIIARHPTRDIRTGTLLKILKDLELTLEDLENV